MHGVAEWCWLCIRSSRLVVYDAALEALSCVVEFGFVDRHLGGVVQWESLTEQWKSRRITSTFAKVTNKCMHEDAKIEQG